MELLSLKDLRALAARHDLKGRSAMNKAQLAAALYPYVCPPTGPEEPEEPEEAEEVEEVEEVEEPKKKHTIAFGSLVSFKSLHACK